MKPISTKKLDLYNSEKSDNSDESQVMPLILHLTELRKKALISLLFLCITTLIGFALSKEIIRLLINIAPKDTTFLQIKPGEFFFVSMKAALCFGLALASPVIIWQLASFILPGLTEKEKKITIPILLSSPAFFLIGIVFAYFFVAPSMINFLFGFGKEVISSSISIESFISFALMIMAVCGIVFLLPVVIFALASAKIVDYKMLISQWRYAILSSLLLGAILTPTPDPFNMAIISGVLIVLYFLSIGILKILQ